LVDATMARSIRNLRIGVDVGGSVSTSKYQILGMFTGQ
jgi:hypothetical protein